MIDRRSSSTSLVLICFLSSCGGGAPGGGKADPDPDPDPEVQAPPTEPRPGARFTARALWGTPTNSLLLDPFMTTDASYGHFLGFLLEDALRIGLSVQPTREFESLSPAGVTAPRDAVPAERLRLHARTFELLAPLPGSSTAVNAALWVAATDSTGTPVEFAAAGAGLAVNLQPNDQPTISYPLLPVDGTARTLGNQPWVQLALQDPVPLPEGGWFSVSIGDLTTVRFWFQAPEVVPVPASAPVHVRTLRSERRSAAAQPAAAAYMKAVRDRPRKP